MYLLWAPGAAGGAVGRCRSLRVGPGSAVRRSAASPPLLSGLRVGEAGEEGVALGEGGAGRELGPGAGALDALVLEGAELGFGAEEGPEPGGGLRHRRVVQDGDRPQYLGRGVDDRRQAGALGLVLGNLP